MRVLFSERSIFVLRHLLIAVVSAPAELIILRGYCMWSIFLRFASFFLTIHVKL